MSGSLMKNPKLIKEQKPGYKPLEEALCSMTHAIGAVLSFIGTIILVDIAVKNEDIYQIVGFSIFGSTLSYFT